MHNISDSTKNGRKKKDKNMINTLDKNIKNNIIYNMAYQLLTMLIPLISMPYISRVLGPEGIGNFAYYKSVASSFILFILLGVNKYGNREVARVRDDINLLSQTFIEIYSIQLITSAIVCPAYILFAIFDKTIFSYIMLIYVISATLDITWFFSGLEDFKNIVKRNSILKVISLLMMFILVKNKHNVDLYCLIYALGMFLSQAYMWSLLRSKILINKFSLQGVLRSAFKNHIKSDLLLFIPVLSIGIYKIMDKIMLGIISSKTENGFYENCDLLVQVPIAFITSFGLVMLPRVSYLVSKGHFEVVFDILQLSLCIAVVVSSFIGFCIMSVSNEFIPLFFGRGFDRCIIILDILMPTSLFIAIANVIRTQILIPNRRDIVYIVSIILGAITNLMGNIILIPVSGAVGAAISTLIAEGTVCICQFVSTSKYIKVVELAKVILCCLIIGAGLCVFLRSIVLVDCSLISILFIKIIIYSSIFLAIIFILWKATTKKNNLI